MDNGDFIISLKDVSYYHVGKDTPTLNNLDLQIRRGSLSMIIGPSGSGKTTLCDILAGVIPHIYGGKLSGDVIIDGLNSKMQKEYDIALKVGKVFQDPEVMFSMLEVEDEVAFGPENLEFEPTSIAASVERSLEYTELHELRRSLVWELSGGQVQRLGLACILAMSPPIIVLDEPTANLDPIATQKVHALALKLKNEGKTVVLVTKETDEFLEQADEIFVLKEGHIVCSGTPQEVIDEHGDYLADELGIWLPEVCEVGLGLRQKGLHTNPHLPLNVEDALTILEGPSIEFITDLPSVSIDVATPPIDMPLLISAKDITYTYPNGRRALNAISFEVRQGDLLAIVGRNGAGKSTLSKLLVGLLKPTNGTLKLFGKDALQWEVADLSERIALVFQNPEHQFLTDTVFDEIAYSFNRRGQMDPAELNEEVTRLLKLLDLEDVAKDHPFALSAGKKRRLGVAAMMVGSPQVLLVDEPTYGQDKAMTSSLMQLMLKLRDMGITIIMITHSMRLVEEYAERVIVMNEGLKTFDGNPRQLFAQPEIMAQASLAVTTLQTLITQLDLKGKKLPPGVKSVTTFLEAINLLNASPSDKS